MREIKTESQTLDLSKKVTVEVSLAELIVIKASIYEAATSTVWRLIEAVYGEKIANNARQLMTNDVEVAESISDILAGHITKEDE
ncbi:hypothetical protein FO510_05385 [Bacillus pumilus]|uniref:hypothetical protein n=1 Tax=Bacillus pumilus TaxID=1408 RepID=UPI00017A5FC3|nr:hypothetical protein [Bacillus pumilus]EDW22141.1 hypothetical protein BAT_0156 [Bacillus pumilus ATCC 7061]MCR4352203.1 hypothetical protein [Bacillus pumilus]MCY7504014.1 hypothetical protein [Bacillus pumilus]MDR4268997.1 hypothetical protein [Bacillus pumilus]MDR4269084.1 hypothetical protein [Bacillus pumilus]